MIPVAKLDLQLVPRPNLCHFHVIGCKVTERKKERKNEGRFTPINEAIPDGGLYGINTGKCTWYPDFAMESTVLEPQNIALLFCNMSRSREKEEEDEGEDEGEDEDVAATAADDELSG